VLVVALVRQVLQLGTGGCARCDLGQWLGGLAEQARALELLLCRRVSTPSRRR
jgi:hypothetical protein